jgi:hypothetical protein
MDEKQANALYLTPMPSVKLISTITTLTPRPHESAAAYNVKLGRSRCRLKWPIRYTPFTSCLPIREERKVIDPFFVF